MVCRNNATERKTQQTGVKVAAANVFRKRLDFGIPCVFEDRVRNLFGFFSPRGDISGKAEKRCDPGATIQGDLAQSRRICEMTRGRADFPDPVVGVVTGVSGSSDELSQTLPQARFDRSVRFAPLISTIENLSIHIMLDLFHCGIPPS